MVKSVNLAQKMALVKAPWKPAIVAELNGQLVKVVRISGEYVWHAHQAQDEMFLVLTGSMRICLRDGDITLNQGEFAVIPRGVEHKPVADSPAEVMLFEPADTRSTGDVDHEYTIEADACERI